MFFPQKDTELLIQFPDCFFQPTNSVLKALFDISPKYYHSRSLMDQYGTAEGGERKKRRNDILVPRTLSSQAVEHGSTPQ